MQRPSRDVALHRKVKLTKTENLYKFYDIYDDVSPVWEWTLYKFCDIYEDASPGCEWMAIIGMFSLVNVICQMVHIGYAEG